MSESNHDSLSEIDRIGRRRRSAIRLLSNLSHIISSRYNDMNTNDCDEETGDINFDSSLPSRHEYLGSDLEELRGRTLHDEGSVVMLPILPEISVVLVPGQVLPLTVFYPPTIAMLHDIISKDRTFGVVCVGSVYSSGQRNRNVLSEYGTTAEIFQYQEDGLMAGFKIKARGRQRFRLLDVGPGLRVFSAKVLILPEVTLSSSLSASRLLSLDKYRSNKSTKYSIVKQDSMMTAWPDWIHFLYDPEHLVKKVLLELKNAKLEVSSTAPPDAIGLSYWITQCLPIDDMDRVKLLGFDSAIERLRFALSLLEKCQKLYCRHCGSEVADRKDIFSMSCEGPQGVYCNPDGHVHETITLYKVDGLRLAPDPPSVEYSWFPGYGWTIATCDNCHFHMGWCFTAAKPGLRPSKFWGLTKRSVKSQK